MNGPGPCAGAENVTDVPAQMNQGYDYRVLGLPPYQEARITNWDGGWRILYLAPGVKEEWNGPHDTPEEALDTLARTIGGDEAESPG